MHELLEELNSPFKDKFKSEVDLTEITRFSLNLHKNAAVVVTNSYIYLLNKKLFATRLKKIALKDLIDIEVKEKKINVNTREGVTDLLVAPDKKSSVMKLVNKIKELRNN